MKVVFTCVECGETCHAPWPESAVELSDFMHALWRECRYVMSVATKGEDSLVKKPKDTLLAPLCESCAGKVHGPELMRAVAEDMKKRSH